MVHFEFIIIKIWQNHFIHFKMRNTHSLDTKFEYNNRIIACISYTKFHGITIENMLYWKSHRDQLLPKFSAACYAIRVLKPLMIQEILVMIYYTYFHSIMNYGVIFWGNSPYSINICRLQKRQLELLQILGTEIPVEMHLKH
jgi:hypothetical protein